MAKEKISVLDKEWVELIMQAKNLGVSKEDVLAYIRKKKPSK